MSRRIVHARRRAVLKSAVAEVLEKRVLLAAPHVLPPPAADTFSGTPDKHFYMEYGPQRLVFDFDQPVTISDSRALQLINLTRGSNYGPSTWTRGASNDGTTQTFSFVLPYSAYTSGSTWRGNYQAVLNADLITNDAGDKLDSNGNGVGGEQELDGDGGIPLDDYSTDFFFLPGDANHDRTVNIDDMGRLDFSQNIGLTGYSNGDFNYDGKITVDDWGILDWYYGSRLPLPPTAPNTLTASAAHQDVQLAWTAPQGVDDLDYYLISRSIDGGVTFYNYDVVYSPDTTYDDDGSLTSEGMLDGQKYEYRVRAHSPTLGFSMATNKYWAVTTLPAPDGVSATPIDSSSVNVNWSDNSNPGAISYEIEVTPSNGGASWTIPVAASGPGAHSYPVAGLDPGTNYTFQVMSRTLAAGSLWSLPAGASTARDVRVSLSGPASTFEGSEYALDISLGGFNAADVTDLSVNWGDGHSDPLGPTATDASHTYDDGDAGGTSRTITVTAKAASETVASDTLDLTVQNVAPTLSVSGPGEVAVNTPYTISLASRDPGDDTITSWDFDWGDDSPHTSTPTHTYSTANTYSITATATDDDGSYSGDALSVHVYNAGDPDISFGTGGVVSDPSMFSPVTAARQPDGKIVVAVPGYQPLLHLRIARYMPDGILDTGFGGSGYFDFSPDLYGGPTPAYSHLALQPDGGILVTSSLSADPGIFRLNSAGSPDPSFGVNGAVTNDFSATAIAAMPDGRFVVAGWTDGWAAYAIARYLPSGALDPSFGDSGMVSTPASLYSAYDTPMLALDEFGDVITGAMETTGPSGSGEIRWMLRRYKASDGSPDPAFDGDGIANVASGMNAQLQFMTEDSHGRISLAGRGYVPGTGYSVQVVRVNPTGSLDQSFGQDGILVTQNPDSVTGLVPLPDGDTLVGEYDQNALKLARLRPDGSLDAAFGNSGIATAAGTFIGTLEAQIFPLSDGAIVVVGSTAIARFQGDPALNLTAHRTGGKLGQSVSESVEDSHDPKNYLILTNNDYEQGLPDGQRDYADDTAAIPPTSGSVSGEAARAPIDDDLARITLHKIGPYLTAGTLDIELSDPSAVRLFKSDGTELTDRTLNLADPSGYLSALTSGDVDVWVEGLTKNPDFTFAEVWRDGQGRELARDDVHMLVATLAFNGEDDGEVPFINKETATNLLEAAEDAGKSYSADDPFGPMPPPTDSTHFKLHLDGVPQTAIQEVKVVSHSGIEEYADTLTWSGDDATSAVFAVVYSGELLSPAQHSLVNSRLGLNAIHNDAADAKVVTPMDEETRSLTTTRSLSTAIADGRLTIDEINDLNLTDDEMRIIIASSPNMGHFWTWDALDAEHLQTAATNWPDLPARRRLEMEAYRANLAQSRQILIVRANGVAQYVQELYDFVRGWNPVQYVGEKSFSIGSGYDPVLGTKVDRLKTAAQVVLYIGVLWGVGKTAGIFRDMHCPLWEAPESQRMPSSRSRTAGR